MKTPLLDIRNLSVSFRTRDGTVNALENVSFSLARGETLGIVGESGSGKSVAAYAIMHLLGKTADVSADRMMAGGADLLKASEDELKQLRGSMIAMIFQNARSALNPIRPIGMQLVDVLRQHRGMTRSQAHKAAVDALAEVRIPDPARRFTAYPFELSGGMCQRVMIALAFACEPDILIADEPTTGLDVTTQATIMDLIREKSQARQMATILITHDLGLAADYCDRFAVMHAGHVVERGSTQELFYAPQHPYSGMLIAATPTGASKLENLYSIPGNLPDLRGELPSCRFIERCPKRAPVCVTPWSPQEVAPGHIVGCHMPWENSR